MKYLFEAKNYINYLHNIFNLLHIGVKNTFKIGEVVNGVAFLYENKVYKITSDKKEVELAYHLLNEKSKYYVQIFDIFWYDTEQGEDNIKYNSINNPRYYWIIVEEYVKTDNKLDTKSFNEADIYFIQYIDSKFKYTKEEFEEMIEFYKEDLGYEFTKNDVILNYLILFKNLFLDLQKYGVLSVTDIKPENIGIINNEYKFFDLRLDKGEYKDIKNIKKL